MNAKIAIQGKGSFHHQVAQEYYKARVVVDECLSLKSQYQLVCRKTDRQLWQSKTL
jgi:prephenate dehydratase